MPSNQPGEPLNLEYLDSDWKLATVYTAFLFPKSQQDAIRLIYKVGKGNGGRAPIIHHPVNWIIDARAALMDQGILLSTDTRLRNSVIKSNIEPIIDSLKAANSEGSSDPKILEGVRLVLDSDWFRTFFSYQYLYTPITYRDTHVYEPYRNIVKQNPSGDRLEIQHLQNRLFHLLYEIGYYCHNIRWILKSIDSVHEINSEMKEHIALDDLITSQNFDQMLEQHREAVPSKFIEKYYSCIANTRMQHMYQQFPEKLIKNLLDTRAGLFMPSQVSILLRSCQCVSSIRPVDCGYIMKKFIGEWYRDEERSTQ